MFAKTPGVFTMIKPNSRNRSLYVLSTAEDSSAYCRTFDEAECSKLSGGLPWHKLCEQLHNACTGGQYSTTMENGNCVFEVPSTISFSLPKAPKGMNGDVAMLNDIVSYVRLRTVKDPEKLLKEMTEKEAKQQRRAREAQEEANKLMSILDVVEIEEKSEKSLKALREAEQEIKHIDKSRRQKEPGGEVHEEGDTSVLARNPLGDKECVDIDVSLLSQIKSQFWKSRQQQPLDGSTEEEISGQFAPFMNVVPLLPLSELEQSYRSDLHSTVLQLLQRIDEWDFDVFALQTQMTGSYGHEGLVNQPRGGSLFVVMYAIMVKHGFLYKFNMNERVLLNWISLVEAGYHPNPYHNSMHAADVVHVTNFIIHAGGLAQAAKLSDEDIFAALFAAAIHDYNHPGINNNFHIKAQTYLAVLFNDKSILENVHVSCTFELMKLEAFDVLECFSEEQRRVIKEAVVDMVLATDMGLHAKILSSFKRRLAEDRNFVKREDVKLAMSMAMKMADISNCGRPEALYLRWCDQISDEFYLQGDRERNIGQIVSPFMDRYSTNVAKGQTAFMNYIVIPLFECMSDYLKGLQFTVDFCESNKAYWSAKG